MPSKGKAKGNKFERNIAAHLGTVFNLNFERVPNSGAFIGGKNKFRINQLTESQQLLARGDIIVPEELSHISMEMLLILFHIQHYILKAYLVMQICTILK